MMSSRSMILSRWGSYQHIHLGLELQAGQGQRVEATPVLDGAGYLKRLKMRVGVYCGPAILIWADSFPFI